MIGSDLIARLKPYFKTTPKAGASAPPGAAAGGGPGPSPPAPPAAAQPPSTVGAAPSPPSAPDPTAPDAVASGELANRHEQLARKLAELQWDLGGLTYEMAIRDHFRLDLLVRKAAEQRTVDAELAAVERIMRLEQVGAAGTCLACGALYSRGAVFCWQCGSTLSAQSPIAPALPPGRAAAPLAPSTPASAPEGAPAPSPPEAPTSAPPQPPQSAAAPVQSPASPAPSSAPPGNGAAPAGSTQAPAAAASESQAPSQPRDGEAT